MRGAAPIEPQPPACSRWLPSAWSGWLIAPAHWLRIFGAASRFNLHNARAPPTARSPCRPTCTALPSLTTTQFARSTLSSLHLSPVFLLFFLLLLLLGISAVWQTQFCQISTWGCAPDSAPVASIATTQLATRIDSSQPGEINNFFAGSPAPDLLDFRLLLLRLVSLRHWRQIIPPVQQPDLSQSVRASHSTITSPRLQLSPSPAPSHSVDQLHRAAGSGQCEPSSERRFPYWTRISVE